MNKEELRKFVQFCAEARSMGDFEVHFNMSRGEVNKLKIQLEIYTPQDAKRILKDAFELDDKTQELRRSELQNTLNKRRDIEQQRLEAAEARRTADAGKRRKNVLNATKIKKQDKARQNRLNKQQAKVTTTSTSWRYDGNVDTFKHEITNLGMRFVKEKYGITIADIKSEVSRLKLRIDFDLVPR